MVNSKIRFGKIVLIALCLILVYTCAGRSFLGHGISADTIIGTVTQTDFPQLDENADLDAFSPPEDAVQYKNVIVTVSLNRNNVDNGCLEILSSDSLVFHKYKNVDVDTATAMNMVDTSYYELSSRMYLDFYNTNQYQSIPKSFDFIIMR